MNELINYKIDAVNLNTVNKRKNKQKNFLILLICFRAIFKSKKIKSLYYLKKFLNLKII